MAQGQDDHPVEGHEDDIDHCVCDIDLPEDEATSDADLPAAAGGVEAARGQSAEIAEDTDGCDLDFNESDPTTDEELPVAIGGIA
jgi:hypothetical protein